MMLDSNDWEEVVQCVENAQYAMTQAQIALDHVAGYITPDVNDRLQRMKWDVDGGLHILLTWVEEAQKDWENEG